MKDECVCLKSELQTMLENMEPQSCAKGEVVMPFAGEPQMEKTT